MAKNRLDWFKLDCQLDDKFELIESEFGLKGFAIVVKLYQKIYGGEGYYCEWNEDVALLFAKRTGLGGNVVSEIVDKCIQRGIFSGELYEKYGILTSHGIQRRYYESTERRKFSKIRDEYLLLKCTPRTGNADISSENVNIFQKNDNIPTTEKRRVEKRRREKKQLRLTAQLPRPLPLSISLSMITERKTQISMYRRSESGTQTKASLPLIWRELSANGWSRTKLKK